METSIVSEEIKRVVGRIWELTLELPISYADGELPSSSLTDGKAQIQISGAWNGTLEIEASPALMKTIARRMFDLQSSVDPADEQVEDAFKEISNVIGGNLKTVLPEPCELSLPRMSYEENEVSASSSASPLLELVFESEQEALITRVFKS